MKQIKSLVFLSFILIAGCSKRESLKILDGYEMPLIDSVDRTFYYRQYPREDTMKITFEHNIVDGKKYVTELTYQNDQRTGSRVFHVTQNTKELIKSTHYFYRDTTVIQLESEIIKHFSHSQDQYSGGTFEYRQVLANNKILRFTVVETFEKDTIYSFNGETLPAKKFSEQMTGSTFLKYLPMFPTTTESNGYIIFSKGIGVSYMKFGGSEVYEAELIRVERK
jgi:hypothetical protein